MIMKGKVMNKKTNPYGTYGLGKIDAPKKAGKEKPAATKTTGKGDLRVGKKA